MSRSSARTFAQLFDESSREQKTKFAHFACITFAQYCTSKIPLHSNNKLKLSYYKPLRLDHQLKKSEVSIMTNSFVVDLFDVCKKWKQEFDIDLVDYKYAASGYRPRI